MRISLAIVDGVVADAALCEAAWSFEVQGFGWGMFLGAFLWAVEVGSDLATPGAVVVDDFWGCFCSRWGTATGRFREVERWSTVLVVFGSACVTLHE